MLQTRLTSRDSRCSWPLLSPIAGSLLYPSRCKHPKSMWLITTEVLIRLDRSLNITLCSVGKIQICRPSCICSLLQGSPHLPPRLLILKTWDSLPRQPSSIHSWSLIQLAKNILLYLYAFIFFSAKLSPNPLIQSGRRPTTAGKKQELLLQQKCNW